MPGRRRRIKQRSGSSLLHAGLAPYLLARVHPQTRLFTMFRSRLLYLCLGGGRGLIISFSREQPNEANVIVMTGASHSVQTIHETRDKRPMPTASRELRPFFTEIVELLSPPARVANDYVDAFCQMNNSANAEPEQERGWMVYAAARREGEATIRHEQVTEFHEAQEGAVLAQLLWIAEREGGPASRRLTSSRSRRPRSSPFQTRHLRAGSPRPGSAQVLAEPEPSS